MTVPLLKLILTFSLLLVTPGSALGREAAFAKNRELGRGINLGNMFEAPSEDAWGNRLRPHYIPLIAELGFSHVRIPIRWETPERSLAEPPYTVSPDFLERIKGVVDQALEEDLHVIINMHHHTELLREPGGQRERFLAQWSQIAEFFAGYPDRLLFEIFNEPHDAFTAALWNEYLAEALQRIRQGNPTRFVLIGTAEWGGPRALPKLVLPEDEYLILTIHYYSPFPFTHQGAPWVAGQDMERAVGTQWHDTEAERAAVRRDLQPIAAFSKKQNIPVHIGEFGAYRRADLESRVRWTRFLARTFEALEFSWAYWEFSAGFGIYEPSDGSLVQPLADALLKDTMPDSVE